MWVVYGIITWEAGIILVADAQNNVSGAGARKWNISFNANH